ncbi:MAG: hypothetical protein II670_08125 [Alphaproteobacteria bacterium]|nr:hypothetical protein [Alphaproteobacteria bacterium]
MTNFKAGDVVQLVDRYSINPEITAFFNAYPSGIFTVRCVYAFYDSVGLVEDNERKFNFRNSRFKLLMNASETSTFEVTNNDLEQLLNDENSA